MPKILIKYNPYLVETTIEIAGKPVSDKTRLYSGVQGKRLQEWIEPKKGYGSNDWKGIFKELYDAIGFRNICLEFKGTKSDFADLEYAKEKYGKKCFSHIDLKHITVVEESAERLKKLKELYTKLKNGPITELKTQEIQRKFENAINSDFRIVVVATMSSGKSTLLNAIMGQNLLPAANQATTAVITEIRDNDNKPQFTVSAKNDDKRYEFEGKPATAELIADLNSRNKDNNEKSRISAIELEGNIPNLSSAVLNTVFVDTPGGNNSRDESHAEVMDSAIGDENNSIILYVFDGQQLGTNDSDAILNKIAEAMKYSVKGKQSRDRFLFVANKMDAYDPSKEKYEVAIKNIKDHLSKYGILEPRLFLVSADAAKLVRLQKNGCKLKENDADNYGTYEKKFMRDSRHLSKYASLSESAIEELENEATGCVSKGNTLRVVEINSGIPALEYAINDYLEKYALAIKIKAAVDSFVHTMDEKGMLLELQESCSESEEERKKVMNSLKNKKEELDNKKKKEELQRKVKELSTDFRELDPVRVQVIKEIENIAQKYEGKVCVEKAEAERIIKEFEVKLEKIVKSVPEELNKVLKDKIMKACKDILDEYKEYINDLKLSNEFSIGVYNIANTAAYFEIDKTREKLEEAVQNGKYSFDEEEKTETGKVNEPGFWNMVKRWLGWGGYKYTYEIRHITMVKINELLRNEISNINNDFEKYIDEEKEKKKKAVEHIKQETNKAIGDIDSLIEKTRKEIEELLSNEKKLKEKVENDKSKKNWLENFNKELKDLLSI